MKGHKSAHLQQIEARAKEEASRWDNEHEAKQIRESFEHGLKLREIRDAVFPNWSAGLTGDDQYFRKYTIDHVVLKALDCDDWDDYSRKQTKLRVQRKRQELEQAAESTDR
jgi:hypothetical protein